MSTSNSGNGWIEYYKYNDASTGFNRYPFTLSYAGYDAYITKVTIEVQKDISEESPAAPVITGNNNFTESTQVTINAESGATVYYTTDGSTPTKQSNEYTAPFTLTETTTVKAIAVKGSLSSDVAEATFTKDSGGQGEVKPNAPTINGTTEFTESTQVTINAESDATVYYTTDGSTPTQESTQYTAPFTLTETATVKAIAVKGSLISDVAEATFTKKAAQVEGKTIAELAAGAADVASVAIKFTNAQVVYASDGNYIVRENGLALDLLNSSLSLQLGATLNGTVTMSFAYNGGIMQAKDISGVTNTNNLTQKNATGAMIPVTTTPAKLTNYKGDLVKLEQVTLKKVSGSDIGLNDKEAYVIQSGWNFFYFSNAADFSDKLTDLSKKYDLIAWYNAPGSGMVKATLQIVEIPGGQSEVKPNTPVITGDAEFTESTLVTITAESDATVYYTTDGSTPTAASTKYTEPFTLTETATVKAIAVRGSLSSDVAEATFTKKAAQVEGKTIADLAEAGTSEDNVTLKLTNAKVVYAEGKNYVIRENGKAIDLLNTSLTLQQGSFLTGTVKVNVTYTDGILTTSDIDGQTNANALTVNTGSDTSIDALSCDSSEVKDHPGDVVKVKNQTLHFDYTDGLWYFNTDSPIYLDNANAFVNYDGKQYDATLWFTGFTSGHPVTKILEWKQVITELAAPSIKGAKVFATTTTVTITADAIAKIHYTLDGSDPTAKSPEYTEPLTLSETTTVKAIAVYESIVSDVTTKTFTKTDLTAPMTLDQLAACKTNIDQATVKFENAQVVYADGNNYIIREGNQAIDVMNTQLPFIQGATVTGTVKLKVNYTDCYKAGLLTTEDIADTKADNLTVTAGDNTLPIPRNISIADVLNYPGDLLTMQDAIGDASTNDGVTDYSLYGNSTSFNLSVPNGADYNIASNTIYDVCVWYTGLNNRGGYSAKIIGLKDSYEYTLTDAGWGTLIVPFDCAKPSGTDWTIYESKGVNESGVLKLDEANCIKANTPYIVKGTAATSTLEGYAAIHEDTYTNGFMTGVYADNLTAPIGSYIMQKQDGKVAFYRVHKERTLSPYRCYINEGASPSGVIRFPGDDTNGIGGIGATNTDLVDVYTTTGMKGKSQVQQGEALDNLPAGIYIINNKKVIKK